MVQAPTSSSARQNCRTGLLLQRTWQNLKMILKTLSDWFKTSLGSLVLHLVTADVAQIKETLSTR